jgi:hypothetical protein
MDWAGWALFGLLATAALTAVMITAQMAGLTRIDLPLMLGTLVTEDPDRDRVAGFFIHLAIGQGFAFGYGATFALLGRATWWIGEAPRCGARRRRPHRPGSAAARGAPPHGVGSCRPASTASLEPPGLFGLNYGSQTPAVAIAAHLTHGVALGGSETRRPCRSGPPARQTG